MMLHADIFVWRDDDGRWGPRLCSFDILPIKGKQVSSS